ncbi:MAG: hypothetical protein ABIZ80_21300, partial [Bryobacteraceae bacterium]
SLFRDADLGPQATEFASISELFPAADGFLGSRGIGLAVVTSRSDLAVVQLTQHRTSGAWSAEHFMARPTYYNGQYYKCCGA